MPPIDLDEISRRPLQAMHADGISELIMGLTFLFWGIVTGAPFLVPKGSWWGPYWMVSPFVLAASGFASQWLMKRLKERWSYSRAGYVQYKTLKHGWLWAGMGTALMSMVIVLSFRSRDWRDLLPLGISIVTGAALMYGLRHCGFLRGGVYATVIVALGVAVTAAKLSLELAFGALWAGLGSVLAIGGGARLMRFLKKREVQHG